MVTLPFGTATSAFGGFGVPVAGKSGTAETGSHPHALFPAFAPMDDPTIAVSTILLHTPLATGGVGGDLPAYVGAVPPPGAPAWDWQSTWDSHHPPAAERSEVALRAGQYLDAFDYQSLRRQLG